MKALRGFQSGLLVLAGAAAVLILGVYLFAVGIPVSAQEAQQTQTAQPAMTATATTTSTAAAATSLNSMFAYEDGENVYVTDLTTGEVTNVSAADTATVSGSRATSPMLSRDGRTVAYVFQTWERRHNSPAVGDIHIVDIRTGQLLVDVEACHTVGEGNGCMAPSVNDSRTALAYVVWYHATDTTELRLMNLNNEQTFVLARDFVWGHHAASGWLNSTQYRIAVSDTQVRVYDFQTGAMTAASAMPNPLPSYVGCNGESLTEREVSGAWKIDVKNAAGTVIKTIDGWLPRGNPWLPCGVMNRNFTATPAATLAPVTGTPIPFATYQPTATTAP